MFNIRLAGDHVCGKWLLVVSLMASYFMLSFSHDISWMNSRIKLSQFLRILLPTLHTVRLSF